MDDQPASSTISFTSILSEADLVQHIVGPIYRAGHTFDVVITQSSTLITVVVEPPTISDHSLVVSDFSSGPVLNHVWVNLPFSSWLEDARRRRFPERSTLVVFRHESSRRCFCTIPCVRPDASYVGRHARPGKISHQS